MSRHTIRAKTPERHEITVGWDRPLRTFFAHVHDRDILRRIDAEEISEDDEDPIILWVGGKHGECPTVEELAQRLEPYADIPAEIRAVLAEDKTQNRMG